VDVTHTTTVLKKNTYFDSVSLMSISTKANELDDVEQASIGMGTEMNKEVLRSLGLFSPQLDEASGGDLMIVLQTAHGADPDKALVAVEELFTRKRTSGGERQSTYRTIDAAIEYIQDANVAVIAVNGAFAVHEARKAVDAGLHVMLFSDNVSIEDEVALKTLAHDKGLLMMGPDCGTAIINHVGLCFANAVRAGSIGIVAASGTGSQEVSVRIHELGGGVSQLIGTGGRDLSEQVGAIMMLDGMRALEADPHTEVIVLISKPPAVAVEKKVLAQVKLCKKPVVVCFIGGSAQPVVQAGATFAGDTRQAALAAVLATGMRREDLALPGLDVALIETVRARLTPQQRYIRGLFCGGTICDEIMYAVLDKHPDVYSNVQKDPTRHLDATSTSIAHTFLDFGDDAFTNGRPHPMIDPSLRTARFLQEAKDPDVGVIVLDFILGYGSHPDPVGVMLPAITEARRLAAQDERHLEILGYVLGTDLDRTNLDEQIAKLRSAGVSVAHSCAEAGLLCREFIEKGENQ
jgi:succinyl-CoA synthetase alpha subunit